MLKHFIIAAALILSACAQSGTPYPQAATSLPKLKANESRLYVYRESSWGFGIQPALYLDGQKIGDSVSHAFTVKTIAPGKHVLSASTETETRYAFSTKPGETIYIKTSIGFGVLVGRIEFNLATPEQAEEDLKELLQQEGPNA